MKESVDGIPVERLAEARVALQHQEERCETLKEAVSTFLRLGNVLLVLATRLQRSKVDDQLLQFVRIEGLLKDSLDYATSAKIHLQSLMKLPKG